MREKPCRQDPPERRSFGQFACMLLVALSFLGADCEPSGPEAVGAVMAASPFVFVAGLVMLSLLYWIWKPMLQSPRFFHKSFGITLCVLIVLSPIAYFTVPGASKWAGVALWMFGTSYLSVLLVVWRIWLFKKSETAFSHAPLAALIGILSPAPILFLAPLSHEATNALTIIPWLWPGLLGYTTFPLFMMAVFEAIGRRVFPKESPPKDRNTSAGS